MDKAQRPRAALGVGLVLVAVSCIFCSRQGGNSACDLDRPMGGLVIPEDAKDVECSETSNKFSASYEVEAEFPWANVIDNLRATAEGTGWRPLDESLITPGMTTSFARGWDRYFLDKGPRRHAVHEWWGEWEDEYGSLLVAIVEIRCPVEDDEHSRRVTVHIVMMDRNNVG